MPANLKLAINFFGGSRGGYHHKHLKLDLRGGCRSRLSDHLIHSDKLSWYLTSEQMEINAASCLPGPHLSRLLHLLIIAVRDAQTDDVVVT